MKKITLTLVTVLLAITGKSQNVEFKSSNFKNDKDGFKEAIDAIKNGDEYFELANNAVFEVRSPGLNYELAISEYEKAQKFNPNNGELNFKIGVCYANSPFKEESIDTAKKAGIGK